tara:strand:+ start:368 stop:763 length:396 start_codon:yes stop_codon:yes gene_type:complete
MSNGIGPKLPLSMDGSELGYRQITAYNEEVVQNFKNLVLTIPGERPMDPNFGVGLETFLFEQNVESTYGEISARIRTQAAKYMPFIAIDDVEFIADADDQDNNALGVKIHFTIIPLGIAEVLDANVSIKVF